MLSRVGPGIGREHVLHADVDASTSRGNFGVSAVWPIEKHCKAQDSGGWERGELYKKQMERS